MPLESGEYISDLVQTNPVTATDSVTEGAAHLRLLKKTIQQTFPGFDEPVTLSPAELNDAARKSQAELISGIWSYQSALELGNNVALRSRNFADDGTYRLLRGATDDAAEFGNNTTAMRYLSSAVGHEFQVAGATVMTANRGTGDGLQVELASGAGLTRVATLGDPQAFSSKQSYLADSEIANNRAIQCQQVDTTPRTVLVLDATDLFKLGNPNLNTQLRTLDNFAVLIGGDEVVRAVAQNLGSLLVQDLQGTEKKAAFRNPSLNSIGADRTFIQADENKYCQIAAEGITVTLEALEAGTSFIIASNAFNFTLARGAGVNTLRFLDGLNGTTNFASASAVPGTVLQVYYNGTSSVTVFGSGLLL
jgi:hypothetical protein